MAAHRPRLAHRLVPPLLIACALAAAGPLQADQRDHDAARQALEQGKVLPLRTVLEKVERDYQGQAIKIEFERDDGRFIYEIRLLQNDGRVVKLEVDAVDGKVLSAKRRER
ncbi:MAG TPA: PepSY domain-containing protein [Rubrivivax sp.]|nr:PepSY domain-containing protein [Rubrivivax sp.]